VSSGGFAVTAKLFVVCSLSIPLERNFGIFPQIRDRICILSGQFFKKIFTSAVQTGIFEPKRAARRDDRRQPAPRRKNSLDFLRPLLTSISFGWLIHKAAVGFDGLSGRLFEWKPLLFLGKISYGMYIFHNFMPAALPEIFGRLHLPYPRHVAPWVALQFAATIVAATLSWYYFEQPINKLKRYFPQKSEPKPD
jgi:hypothetical protein